MGREPIEERWERSQITLAYAQPEVPADLRGISAEDDLGPIRYQLLHRTASALKEAQRFGATYAVTVVPLYLGWVSSLPADESRIEAAL